MSTSSGPTTRDLWVLWGQRVREHRLRKTWTQEQLAEASGQSQGTISAIERGVAGGSDLTRYAIETALEVKGLFSFDGLDEVAS